MSAPREFRQTKKGLYIGGLGIAFGLSIVVATLVSTFWGDPTENNSERIPLWVLVPSAIFTLMGIYLVVAQRRTKVSIEGTRLVGRSPFSTYEFDLTNIESASWQLQPLNGLVQLRAADQSAKIPFQDFSKLDRLELIQLIHQNVPEERQHDWARFCHRIALPLREGWPSWLVMDAPESQCVLVTRRHYDRLLGGLLLICIAIAVVLSLFFGIHAAFALPLVAIGFWLLLRLSIPREGSWSLRAPKESAVLILLLPLIAVLPGLLKAANISEQVAVTIIVFFGVALVARIYWVGRRMEKQRDQGITDSERIASSVEAWNLPDTLHTSQHNN
jgi:hypothetical protein